MTGDELGVPPLDPRRGPRWLYRVEMYPGESLTSLICRQSRANGLNVRQLLQAMGAGEGRRLWDLDVGADESLINEFAYRLSTAPVDLNCGMLTEFISRNQKPGARLPLGRGRLRGRQNQWILPNGWQSPDGVNKPRPGGLPFCPWCFLEAGEAWFPLLHRFSLITVCLKHHVELWDRCPKCRAPLSPQSVLANKSWDFGGRDPYCASCLKEGIPRDWRAKCQGMLICASKEVVKINQSLTRSFWGQSVEVPQLGTMTSTQFLAGIEHCMTAARFLLGLGLEAESGIAAAFQFQPPLPFWGWGQRCVEFLPLEERIRRIRWVSWLYEAPLDRWHLILKIPLAPAGLRKRSRHPWELIEKPCTPGLRAHANGNSKTKHNERDEARNKYFLRITQLLGLSNDVARGLLGGMTEMRFLHWMINPSIQIPAGCLHRLDHFLRIWEGALLLFGTENKVKRWILEPNRHPQMQNLPPLFFLARDPDGSRFELLSSWIGRANQGGESGDEKQEMGLRVPR
jgi:hypothetical protein